jgi:hypothetical protein
MSYTNNLMSTDLTQTSTVRPDTDTYFSNANKPSFNASPDQEAAIQSFFEEVTNDKESARLLTTTVIYTALSQNMNPMTVLADFKKLNRGELDLYLATFLNFSRVNSSLLGVVNTPGVNIFVQRSVLA